MLLSPPAHQDVSVRAYLGIVQIHACATLSKEEVLRQSASNRSSLKPLLTSSTDSSSEKWVCFWLSALRSWAEASLSHLCTQLQDLKFPEGREGSYFCTMSWQSLLMHAALSKERGNLLWYGCCYPLYTGLYFSCCEVKMNADSLGMQGSSPPWLGGLWPRTSPFPVRHRRLMQFPLMYTASGRAEHGCAQRIFTCIYPPKDKEVFSFVLLLSSTSSPRKTAS